MKLKNTLAALVAFLLFGSFTLLSAQYKKPSSKVSKQAKITMAQAREAASERVAGKVEEAELEKEAGKLIYSFDIRNAKGTISEVWVDAKTGKVIKVEEENARSEAAEKRQDKKKGKDKN